MLGLEEKKTKRRKNMEITHSGFGGSARPDKIMKVARYNDFEKTVEINVSRLTRNLISAVTNIVVDFAKDHDLHHFQDSVGIPDFFTLEQNIINYFNKCNLDCVERFAKTATEQTTGRIRSLAE